MFPFIYFPGSSPLYNHISLIFCKGKQDSDHQSSHGRIISDTHIQDIYFNSHIDQLFYKQ